MCLSSSETGTSDSSSVVCDKTAPSLPSRLRHAAHPPRTRGQTRKKCCEWPSARAERACRGPILEAKGRGSLTVPSRRAAERTLAQRA
eukprot:5348041-Pleurochrysis_carterae.AAC.4